MSKIASDGRHSFTPQGAFGSVDDAHHQQHNRNLDQHADDRGKRCAGVKPEQADGGGHCQADPKCGERPRSDDGN
jgi:hypothetical protein